MVNKIDSPTKLKLVLILFLSNISVYLMSSAEAPKELSTEISLNYQREGYTELKLTGELLTSFEHQRPITILNKSKKIIAEYALLLEEESSDINELDFNQSSKKTSFIIYLPDREIPKVLGRKDLIFAPYGKNYSTANKNRRNYEVHI